MKKYIYTLVLGIFILGGCTTATGTDTDTTDDASANTDSSGSQEIITFGNDISTDGSAKIEGNTVTVSQGGNYKLTGSNDDAQFIINAPEEDVSLTLSDLDLTSAATSAITVIDAGSLNITLEGENTLSDTENNTDDYQAPIYIDEVETHITGDGILNLNGNYQEGFESNNNLYIDGGTINISAVDDGINAGDLLSINGGNINIDSNGDGLDSNGDLEITGGTAYVSAGNNGNGPIDYGDGGTFTLTGGTVVAVGGNMGVTPTEDGGQTFLTATSSGTSVTAGNLNYEAPKEFSYVFVTSPDIAEDTEVDIDGTAVEASSEIQESTMGMGGHGGEMGGVPAGMERPDASQIPTETGVSADSTTTYETITV